MVKCIYSRMNERKDVFMKEWMKERMYLWKNEWKKGCIYEKMNERKDVFMKGWMKERMYLWKDEWKEGCIYNRMNEWVLIEKSCIVLYC